tara:strand:+ start:304 stop:486 length:183 start_codon:yes stop_codon:yes gene_type:complete
MSGPDKQPESQRQERGEQTHGATVGAFSVKVGEGEIREDVRARGQSFASPKGHADGRRAA